MSKAYIFNFLACTKPVPSVWCLLLIQFAQPPCACHPHCTLRTIGAGRLSNFPKATQPGTKWQVRIQTQIPEPLLFVISALLSPQCAVQIHTNPGRITSVHLCCLCENWGRQGWKQRWKAVTSLVAALSLNDFSQFGHFLMVRKWTIFRWTKGGKKKKETVL